MRDSPTAGVEHCAKGFLLVEAERVRAQDLRDARALLIERCVAPVDGHYAGVCTQSVGRPVRLYTYRRRSATGSTEQVDTNGMVLGQPEGNLDAYSAQSTGYEYGLRTPSDCGGVGVMGVHGECRR